MLTRLISASVVLLLASSTFAQDERPTRERPVGDKPGAERQAEKDRQATPAAADRTFSYKASEVMGATLRDAQDKDIGKIEDLVVDPRTGRIEYAVLSMRERAQADLWYAVPFSELQLATKAIGDVEPAQKPEFKLGAGLARIQNAPGFARDKWPDINAPTWRGELDKFYGSSGNTSGATPATGQLRSWRASELIGKSVQSASNEEVGKIKELGIDPRGARISYFVVTSGPFLDNGGRLVAVPWPAMQITPGAPNTPGSKDSFTLSLPKDKLVKGPEFQGRGARIGERAWTNELYDYYGVRPYWSDTIEAGAGRTKPDAPRDGRDGKDGERPKNDRPKNDRNDERQKKDRDDPNPH